MKKIITIALLVFVSNVFAQEIGKAGVLLKNEATQIEMNKLNTQSNTLGRSSQNSSNQNRTINNNDRNSRNNQNREIGRTTNYRWNNNLGYAEVFLRIPDYGYYTIQLDDQEISSGSGKFRFFDLSSGRNLLSIYENGYLIYKAPLTVQNNTRMVLDFFPNYGLYLLDSYSVRNQNYGINEWDDIWNNPYANSNGYSNNYGRIMQDRDFSNFVNQVKKNNAFDDNRIDFIRQQKTVNQFSAKQIQTLISLLSFDKNKVVLAKDLYSSCIDPQNFYIVYDEFTFSSYKKEIIDFVSRQTR